jgi:toxin ParE1/3/4
MRVRVTRRAARDLAEIVDYITSHSPGSARRVYTTILGSIERLGEYPESGRLQSTPGVRRIVTNRYPYLVYYTVDRETQEVVVIAIQHPARDRDFSDA